MSTTSSVPQYPTPRRRPDGAIGETRTPPESRPRAERESIAIVGIGLRFPGGATDPASFWRLLHEGRDAVTEIPADRWDVEAYYDPDPDVPGKSYSRWGAFLDGIDGFDPHFFGISPREAQAMDPQQRLLLEVSWEALEAAGHATRDLIGSRTGVFVGMIGSDYAELRRGEIDVLDAYFGPGISRSIAAGRISYLFGLHGPNLAIDTACSSSAMATHLACLSLRAGECDMALAGGVNLMLVPDGGISSAKGRMMSFTGRCRAFDAGADGYVRAEGCAMLALKRLDDAVADRDNILAVILGTAVNQDGRSNGITAPNGRAQEVLLRAALADAGLEPDDIGFVEAHGTGTPLGDPIEMQALGAVFGENRGADAPLAIGSVKTNIGHTEAVAGTAGLIKLVLSLRNRTIPPHLHLREPNPHIAWERLPVVIPTSPSPWDVAPGQRRIGGVSSFGFSGTNSHIIVAEPPRLPEPEPMAERPYQVVAISARSAPALEALVERYTHGLEREPADPEPGYRTAAHRLTDVAFTANAGRSHYAERLAVVASSTAELRDRLAAWRAGRSPEGVLRVQATDDGAPEVAFLFTGQGSQYVGMGRQLYETEPVFRAALVGCDELLRTELEHPLLSVLYPPPGGEELAERLIHETAYTQPALFAIEYALTELWSSWGITPDMVMGHSVGEYVAACVAGVFGLEDGLRLIAARGRLMQALPGGGEMAAVFADEATVAAAVNEHSARVSLAAINGPTNVVISGEGRTVRTILEEFAEGGIKSKSLTVSHAFHSPLMEPILGEFEAIASSVEFADPRIGLVSNVTGRIAGGEITTPGYWRQHVREPVRFADAVRALHDQGCTAFLEAGPTPSLLGMAQRCLPAPFVGAALWLPSLRKGRADALQVSETLASLYATGADVDWSGVHSGDGARRVPLPTYPYQRQRYWKTFPAPPRSAPAMGANGEREPGSHRPPEPRLHPLVHQRLRSPVIPGTVFQARLGVTAPGFLNDHRIFDLPLVPGAGFIEMAWAAAREVFGSPGALEAVQIREALVLDEAGERTVQVAIAEPDAGATSFQIFSQEDGSHDWKLHVTGRIRLDDGAAVAPPAADPPDSPGPAAEDPLAEVRERCGEELTTDFFYDAVAAIGVSYGPAFRCLRQVWRRDGEALARIALPDSPSAEAGDYDLHPGLLDACIQLVGTAMPGAADPDASGNVYVPVQLGRYLLHRRGSGALWCHAVLDQMDTAGGGLTASLRLFADEGELIAEVADLRMRKVSRMALRRMRRGDAAARVPDWLYTLNWEPAPVSEPASGWATGHWLILADVGGVGDALAAVLKAEGGSCTLLRRSDIAEHAGPAPAGGGDGQPDLVESVDSTEDCRISRFVSESLQSITGNGGTPVQGAIHLWSLDESGADSAESILEHQRLVCGSTLALVHAMTAAGIGRTRMVLVTRGAQHVPGDAGVVSPAQSPLWGLGNTITLEHPDLGCVCLDLEADPGLDPAQAIGSELAELAGGGHSAREDQVARRGRGRFVARLATLPPARPDSAAPGADGVVELDIAERGILDNLALRPAVRRKPGPGEVEVRVRASGLNFRDVLNALGMYPGDPGPLGSECAGTVVAVGAGVDDIGVGDEVIALAGGSFRSHVITRAELVYPKPAGLSHAAAAGVPIAFLTAYYGLHELAGIKAGDRVLVHAASGGVGLAAVQLALLAGAEVFGTAGSPEKREYLRSIGVDHVMSSRTLEFAGEIMAITGGAGVDIVLNSLADEFIPKSLAVVADDGCFLEIGKRGVWSGEQVAAWNPKLRYHLYDLAEALVLEPAFFRVSMDWLVERFDAGALRPLPLRALPVREATAAFRYMAQARHIGKIVLTHEAPVALRSVVYDHATYVVTGGLGGLGLAVAQWLVERGARNLVLVGRGAPSERARRMIGEIEDSGARVFVFQGDVGRSADVTRLMALVAEGMPPLRGVIHAAGVLDDGVLRQQTWPRFQSVMHPKVIGGWNLHAHTHELPLDFFVLFSTGSAILGSAGQGNYSAANAFLDGLARYRRARGLPATTINWGAWSEVGMAADLAERERERWGEYGMGTISPDDGVSVLEHVLQRDLEQVAVLPVDWTRFLDRSADAGSRPLFSQLAAPTRPDASTSEPAAGGAAATAPDARPDLLRQLEAASPDERQTLLRAHLEDRVRRVLGIDASVPLDPRRELAEMGMDSLMAVELSNHLQSSLGRQLPSTLAFEYPTLTQLATHLATELVLTDSGSDGSTKRPAADRPDRAAGAAESASGEAEAGGAATAAESEADDANLATGAENEAGAGNTDVAGLSEAEARETLLREIERAGY